MPKRTDSDLNLHGDQTIVWNHNVDCPDCDTIFDVDFDTNCTDEDGLTDLEPGDVTADAECPNCGHEFEAVFEGWMNFGDAG